MASTIAAELSLSAAWEGFLLACLLHDVGKGSSGDHTRTGPRLAAEAAAALGESPVTQEDVAFLVREHLLLPDTATRRDLDDPVLIERLAARIAGRERLQMLYLLTVADSQATGPAVWTPWTATLVKELFFKVLHVLEGDAAVGVAQPVGEEVEAPSLAAALPGRPLLTLEIPLVDCARPLSLELRTTHLPDVEELSVVSAPHRGLLTRLSGVSGHPRHHHHERPAPGAGGRRPHRPHVPRGRPAGRPHPPGTLAPSRSGMSPPRWLGGWGWSIAWPQKAARYAPRGGGERLEPPRVVVENGVSEVLTVIEVHAADRIGLLYTIARTLDDLLLDVRLAKVTTLKDRVVDVFYVADSRGRKLVDAGHLAEAEQAILFALERAG